MFCRVCEKTIKDFGWARHVQMHKQEFCRKFGLDPKAYRGINWNQVVQALNPKLAAKDVRKIETTQKTLNNFERKW